MVQKPFEEQIDASREVTFNMKLAENNSKCEIQACYSSNVRISESRQVSSTADVASILYSSVLF